MMQTPSLLSQISTAPVQPRANANVAANNGADAGQFSQALSREVAQRQAPPVQTTTPQKPTVKQPSAPAEKAPAAKPAGEPTQASAKPASAEGTDAPDTEHDAAAAAQAAANTPVVDMLALVASFNQPVQMAQAVAADPQAAVAATVGRAGAALMQGDAAPVLPVADMPPADGAPVDAQLPPDFAARLTAQVQEQPAQRATATAFERIAMPKQQAPAALDG
ncbi:MAG: hypothetical protein ACLGI6_16805, partial [Gammaproteobacteria bacterium]